MFKAIKRTLHRWIVEGRAYNISKIRERRMLIEFHEAWKEENKDFIEKMNKISDMEVDNMFNRKKKQQENQCIISDSFHNLTGNL